MGKFLKGAVVAAAMLWAGTAQAAFVFEIGPGTGARFDFDYHVPEFEWVDLALSGPSSYYVSGNYMVDYRCGEDCYGQIGVLIGGDEHTATGIPTNKITYASTSSSGYDGFIIFGPTDKGSVRITMDDVPGTYTRLALPEPSTWAMMLIGFGVVGSAMRRRVRRPAFL